MPHTPSRFPRRCGQSGGGVAVRPWLSTGRRTRSDVMSAAASHSRIVAAARNRPPVGIATSWPFPSWSVLLRRMVPRNHRVVLQVTYPQRYKLSAAQRASEAEQKQGRGHGGWQGCLARAAASPRSARRSLVPSASCQHPRCGRCRTSRPEPVPTSSAVRVLQGSGLSGGWRRAGPGWTVKQLGNGTRVQRPIGTRLW